jgi:CRP-like cAMP-binding protein
MLDLHVPGRGDVIIESLDPGTVLGWSWLFPPYDWRFGASAAEPVRAIVLDAADVRVMCATDPALGYELTRRFTAVMLDRLQNTRLRLLDLYGVPAGGRP